MKMRRYLSLLLATGAALFASASFAHTSEIFFAPANVDNQHNKSSANVMIMMDTSGSMRFCETDISNVGWCSNVQNRRINMLVSAMHQLIDQVSPGVRIGLSRFRHNGGNSGITPGGYVMFPVVDVNEDTRSLLKASVSELNSAGSNTSGTSSGSPSGGTPTARAYWETALYMLGGTPSTGLYSGSSRDNDSSMCAEYKEVTLEDTCADVFDRWGDWEALPAGSICNDNLNTCKVEYGPWQPSVGCDLTAGTCQATGYGSWYTIPGTCDDAFADVCRLVTEWNDISGSCSTWQQDCRLSDWTSWHTTRNSGANSNNCRTNQNTATFERRRSQGRCQERTRSYQNRTTHYEQRDATGYQEREAEYFSREAIYVKNCDTATICTKTVDIVKNGSYVSPMNMQNQCESNHIVIFTDGAPTSGTTYMPVSNSLHNGVSCSGSGVSDNYSCQVSISSYLSGESNSKDRPIKTYNVGLHMGNNRTDMEEVSTDGDKGTFTASDATSLANAFLDALDLIDKESRVISAPGVAVNQMSRLQHLGQLYYSVFQPEEVGVWQGNLKRYRLEEDKILDAAGSAAVDNITGYFSDNSRSFWTVGGADGGDATLGGARQVLENNIADGNARKLFYADASGTVHELTEAKLAELNGADLGIPVGSTRSKQDVFDALQELWADPLHSVPTLVNYEAASADEDEQDNYVFVSTNGGMLHAIEAKTGTEKFAFMPHETFSQAYSFAFAPPLNYDNTRPKYGLDGSWVAWRQGSASSASKIYLYGGMRRGGGAYYALDVTNLNAPSLEWKIDKTTSGFDRLGQTWSTPTLIQLRIGGKLVPGLVFGGGYSPAQHDKQCVNVNEGGSPTVAPGCTTQIPSLSKTADDMGNAVYIVHATTGQLLWSASQAATGIANAGHTKVDDMYWGVPASVSAVDVNMDGVVDYLYVSDLGAQVFRVDLNSNAGSTSDLVKGVQLLASFTEGGTTGARRFYEAPAVAYVDRNGQRNLVVAIASGYRAHPLEDKINERLYVFKDTTALSYSVPGTTLSAGDLAHVAGVTAAAPSSTELASKQGWMLELDKDGEKAMASPAIFNGRLILTTYKPTTDQDSDPCKVSYGSSYIYVMDLHTSAPASLTNLVCENCSRRTELDTQTPVSQPQLLALEDNKLAVVVGTEVFGDVDGGNMELRKRRWYPIPKNDANEFLMLQVETGEEGG